MDIKSPITMMIVRTAQVIPMPAQEEEKPEDSVERTLDNPIEEIPAQPDKDNPKEKQYVGIFAEAGTKVSGFIANGKQYCGDCIHNSDAVCYHPAVMEDPELQIRKTDNGGIKINPESECCRFIRKPAGDDYDPKSD